MTSAIMGSNGRSNNNDSEGSVVVLVLATLAFLLWAAFKLFGCLKSNKQTMKADPGNDDLIYKDELEFADPGYYEHKDEQQRVCLEGYSSNRPKHDDGEKTSDNNFAAAGAAFLALAKAFEGSVSNNRLRTTTTTMKAAASMGREYHRIYSHDDDIDPELDAYLSHLRTRDNM